MSATLAMTYSAGEVIALAGITYRQLAHWVERGVVWPKVPSSGRGKPARYDSEDLGWIIALGEAARAGVDVTVLTSVAAITALRHAARRLDEAAPDWWLEVP